MLETSVALLQFIFGFDKVWFRMKLFIREFGRLTLSWIMGGLGRINVYLLYVRMNFRFELKPIRKRVKFWTFRFRWFGENTLLCMGYKFLNFFIVHVYWSPFIIKHSLNKKLLNFLFKFKTLIYLSGEKSGADVAVRIIRRPIPHFTNSPPLN
jgi:hypothetical protein